MRHSGRDVIQSRSFGSKNKYQADGYDIGTWRLTWSKCRVQNVDVNADINFCTGDPIFDFGDDAVNTNAINIPGFDNLKAASLIILDISIPQDGCSDTYVDGRVVDQTFFMSDVEKGAMVHSTVSRQNIALAVFPSWSDGLLLELQTYA